MNNPISLPDALAIVLACVALLVAGLSYAQYRTILDLYRKALNIESDWRQRALQSESKLIRLEKAAQGVLLAGNELTRATALQRLELVAGEPIVIVKVEDGRASPS